MDAGDDLAARQLAAVADVLLTWLSADADSKSPRALALPDSTAAALEATELFCFNNLLYHALRTLLARAALARTAAHLAVTSKGVCNTLRTRHGDIVDAAGAACCEHAAAMQRILPKVANSEVCADEELNLRMLVLCSRPSEVAESAALDDEEFEAAMLGAPFSSPLMQGAVEEEVEGVRTRLQALHLDTPPRRSSAAVWKHLADNLEDYARQNPEMLMAAPTVAAFTGGAVFSSPLMRAAIMSQVPEAEDQVDPRLFDALRMPDDQ